MESMLDKGVLEESLRRGLSDDSVEIIRFRELSMSAKGLNFLSHLLGISIEYRTAAESNQTKSKKPECRVELIIKLEPTNDISLNLVREQDLFMIELKILRDILPKISRLVDLKIGPELWYGSENPRMLIMEDLTTKGFSMKDRQKGFSFDHCILAMEKLANWHAGSVALFEKDPRLIDRFRGGILSQNCPEFFLRMMEVSLSRIGQEVENWGNERCAKAANKLKRLAKTIRSRCTDIYKYEPGEFCVLNHGDCWINNIMIRENDAGQPLDLVMVDYQMSIYTSPAIDLLYFLNTCPEIGIKCDQDDVLLSIYLKNLQGTMRKIGCKTEPPNMQKLKKAMHDRRVYAVFSGIVLYLRMIANAEDTEDFELLFKMGGETRMDIFKHPRAIVAALKMIPAMDERGYLD